MRPDVPSHEGIDDSTLVVPAGQLPEQAVLRVAMLLPNLEIGGSQRVVCTLAEHLHEQGVVPVVAAMFAGGPLADELSGLPVELRVFNFTRRPVRMLPWFILDVIRMWRGLAAFLRRHEINVIQTNNLGSQDYLLLALGKWLRIPVITFNFHNVTFLPREAGLGSQLHATAYRVVRRWASDFVAVSDATKQALIDRLGVSERDVTVILNGVDEIRQADAEERAAVRRRLGLPLDATLLIAVGRLVEQKGHAHLIDAMSQIAARHSRAHLLIVGDGDLRAVLQRQVDELGLAARIHFLGSRSDVKTLLVASDIYVMASLWEGLSIALLEAMAAAIPIVATEVAGANQVIQPDVSGILVPPGSPAALAQALHETLSAPEARLRALGNAARQTATTELGAERQASEYASLYAELLAEAAAP